MRRAGLALVFHLPGGPALEINVTVDSRGIPDGATGFLDFRFSAAAITTQTAQVVVKKIAAISR